MSRDLAIGEYIGAVDLYAPISHLANRIVITIYRANRSNLIVNLARVSTAARLSGLPASMAGLSGDIK